MSITGINENKSYIQKIVNIVLDYTILKFFIVICPLVYLFYFLIYDLGVFFGFDIFILDIYFSWIIFIFIISILLPPFKHTFDEEQVISNDS